jgi:hypothetical protein
MLKYENFLWGIDTMQDENTDRLLELQMKELKETYGVDEVEDAEVAPVVKAKSTAKNPKDAKLAEMYADAAEYEKELEGFESELEVVNANALKDIPEALSRELPNEDRDYAQELQAILVAQWTHLVETLKTHPAEQLEVVKVTPFVDTVEALSSAFPDAGDFDKMIRDILVSRWSMLIDIKKEHIKEEMDEIYIAGLKPSFVKRIYKRYHGIQ